MPIYSGATPVDELHLNGQKIREAWMHDGAAWHRVFTSVLPRPVIVDAKAVGASSSASSVTVPTPAHAADDVLLAFVATRNANATLPSGWTLKAVTGTTGEVRMSVFTRVVSGTQPTSFAFAASGASKMQAAIIAVRGGAPGPANVASGTTGTAHTTPSVTTVENALILRAAAGLSDSTAATYTWPAGVTELTDLGYSDFFANGVTLSTAVTDAGGPAGSVTATSTDSDAWAAVTVALEPA